MTPELQKYYEDRFSMMGSEQVSIGVELFESIPHDIPGEWFKGPFQTATYKEFFKLGLLDLKID